MNEKIQETEYLTFFVAGEQYAAAVSRVKEVLQSRPITRVPTMPGWIRGVINLRGSIVPVVDLAVKFGLAQTELTKWACFVIFEVEQDGEPAIISLIADSVNEVISLSESDVVPAPAFGTRIRPDYLAGMAKAGDKLLLLLNLDRAISIDELLEVEAMTTG